MTSSGFPLASSTHVHWYCPQKAGAIRFVAKAELSAVLSRLERRVRDASAGPGAGGWQALRRAAKPAEPRVPRFDFVDSKLVMLTPGLINPCL